ncbi:MAG: hypothetical protein FD153_1480 [Rhodospirillaceae bacterium]|nr:MAG: hypothetical protein FD153_1480 [Rhodospirillaceae bacterium]
MKTYNRGDSIYITCVHEKYTLATDTWAEADADATYPKLTVLDSAGATKVNAAEMTKKATGKYEYQYQIAADAALGEWSGYVQTSNTANLDREYFRFQVV